MSIAKRLAMCVLGLALVSTTVSPVFAQDEEPVAGFGGHAYVDMESGMVAWSQAPPSILAGVDVYSNTTSAANFGFSSTDLLAIWGDRLTTIGTGTLNAMDFTVFNTGTSAGPLLTATVAVSFYDGPTSTFIGGFSTAPISFGAGLGVGFYSVVTVSGLGGLGLNIPTTDIIVTQTVTAKTGTANRLGIVSMNPPTIGSSIPTMYISATTVGPPGFYTITGQIANPGYRVNLDSPPTPAKPTSWGRIKSLYR